MTEEEKKAVKYIIEDEIQHCEERLKLEHGLSITNMYKEKLEHCKTILNLIENHQKENNELVEKIDKLEKEIFQLKIHKYSCPAILTTGIQCDLKQDEKEYLEQIKEQVTGIENLKAIEEEHKKENGELRKKVAELEDELNSSEFVNNLVTTNWIRKQKIKDRIEKLLKEGDYRTKDNPNGRIHFQPEVTDYKIEVLKELLEE